MYAKEGYGDGRPHPAQGGAYHDEHYDGGAGGADEHTPLNEVYADIPSTEEQAAKLEASQYTDSLTPEQKNTELRDGIQMAALLVLGLLGLGFMLVYLDFVLVPLVFSRFLVYCFQPIINYMVGKKAFPLCKARVKLPRWLAVVIVLILIIILFVIFGLIVGVTVADVIEDADKYKKRAQELLDSVIEIAEDWGYTREEVEAMIPDIDIGAYAMDILNHAMNILTQMVLVILIVVYMLLGYDGSNKSTLRAAIDVRIRKYIIIHSFISVITGIGTTIILFIFSVDLAVFNGFMAFVLNYIPNIGSVLGVVLPLPFVLFKDDFQLWELAAVAIALTLFQFVTGQIMEPKMLGNAMDIPPITVICALLFWGSLWGIIGALLSVPLTVAIQLYLESMDHPAAKALAGMIIGDFSMFDKTPPREDKKEKKKSKKKSKKGKDYTEADLELAVPADEGSHYEEGSKQYGSYGTNEDYYAGGRGGYGDDRYPPYGYDEGQGYERGQAEPKKRRG